MERLPEGFLEIGKQYPVSVIKLLDKGIIVELLGTKYTGFIHISKLSQSFVHDVSDVVSVGMELTAECVDTGRGPELSLRNEGLQLKHLVVSEPAQDLDSMILSAQQSFNDKHRSINGDKTRPRYKSKPTKNRNH